MMTIQEQREQLADKKCFFCGGPLSFDGREQAAGHTTNHDGDNVAMVHYLRCKQCGRDYEVTDPNQQERESDYSEYWGKQ